MNETIFFFFYNLAHQSKIFDSLIIFLAVYFVYFVIFLALLFLLFYYKIFFSQNLISDFVSRWKEFFLVCASGGLAWAVAHLLKILIYLPRPFVIFPQVHSLFAETGYAFPSGHTATASGIAFALFFINKKAGYVFTFFALMIGVSRIISGVHFPIDILGGFILGGLVAFLVAFFVKKI